MKEKKLRRSRQRDRILQVLQRASDHPTASEVYDVLKREFPSLSLGNVYRNLNILVDRGLVERLQSGSTFDRFESRKTPHFHFVCDRCGTIVDIDVAESVQKTLDDLVNAQIGIVPHRHRVEFYGICSDCAQ